MRARGRYYLLIIDGHKNYILAVFKAFYKKKRIVIVFMPSHLSYLFQSFDIGYFSSLKRAYDYKIEGFIKSFINYIIKAEFFIAFQIAFLKVFIFKNIKAVFQGAGLIPFNPKRIISKMDIKLSTPLPTETLLMADIHGPFKRHITQPRRFRKLILLKDESFIIREALQHQYYRQLTSF